MQTAKVSPAKTIGTTGKSSGLCTGVVSL